MYFGLYRRTSYHLSCFCFARGQKIENCASTTLEQHLPSSISICPWWSYGVGGPLTHTLPGQHQHNQHLPANDSALDRDTSHTTNKQNCDARHTVYAHLTFLVVRWIGKERKNHLSSVLLLSSFSPFDGGMGLVFGARRFGTTRLHATHGDVRGAINLRIDPYVKYIRGELWEAGA